MPSEFLLSQLAIACKVSVAVQSHRFSCRPIVRRCDEFFAERGVPWKPWNLSGSATADPASSIATLDTLGTEPETTLETE